MDRPYTPSPATPPSSSPRLTRLLVIIGIDRYRFAYLTRRYPPAIGGTDLATSPLAGVGEAAVPAQKAATSCCVALPARGLDRMDRLAPPEGLFHPPIDQSERYLGTQGRIPVLQQIAELVRRWLQPSIQWPEDGRPRFPRSIDQPLELQRTKDRHVFPPIRLSEGIGRSRLRCRPTAHSCILRGLGALSTSWAPSASQLPGISLSGVAAPFVPYAIFFSNCPRRPALPGELQTHTKRNEKCGLLLALEFPAM